MTIRASFICPCVGVGGADGFMQSLIRHTTAPMGSIKWQSVCVTSPVSQEQVNTFLYQTGNSVPLLGRKQDYMGYPRVGMTLYDTWEEQAQAAFKDVDVIISWYQSLQYLKDYVGHAAVIELLQNEDTGVKSLTEENAKLNLVDHYVSVSKSVSVNVPPNHPQSIIYNGFEPSRCMPKFGREYLRQLWNIPADKKIILYLGRTVEEKNCSALIQALSQLPEEYIGLIIGTSYEGIKNTTGQIYSEAAKYAPGRVLHFPHHAYHVGDFYAVADCLLIPSDFEGLPLVLLEAYYAALPVVCAGFNAARELQYVMGQGNPVHLMTDQRPTAKDLADKCRQACTPSFTAGVTDIRRNAFVFARDNCTMNIISAQWELLLQRVVREKEEAQRKPRLISVTQQKTAFATPPQLPLTDFLEEKE